jgi:hypothetical protein
MESVLVHQLIQSSSFDCLYDKFCLDQAAGCDVNTDCCLPRRHSQQYCLPIHQGTHTMWSSCWKIVSIQQPMSCRYVIQYPPVFLEWHGMKTYNNYLSSSLVYTQMLAAGYNSNQCCPTIPDGTPWQSVSAPITCGSILVFMYLSARPVLHALQTWSVAFPVAQGASCTQEVDSVACGPNKCLYSGLSCVVAAGFESSQCSKQPSDTGTCTHSGIWPLHLVLQCRMMAGSSMTTPVLPVSFQSLSPLYYYSFCIFTSCMIVFFLELAGFDPNSCVKLSSYCGRRIAEWWLAWQRQLFSPASTMHWCCPLLLAFLV